MRIQGRRAQSWKMNHPLTTVLTSAQKRCAVLSHNVRSRTLLALTEIIFYHCIYALYAYKAMARQRLHIWDLFLYQNHFPNYHIVWWLNCV